MTDTERRAVIEALNAKLTENDGTLKLSKVPGALPDGFNRTVYDGIGLMRWIKTQFPEFIVDESAGHGKEVLRAAVESTHLPHPAPSLAQANLSGEVRQMHAFSYMNWWPNNLRAFRQYGSFPELDANILRGAIAHQIGLAILGQKGLLLDAVDDEQPRVVIPTGTYSQDGGMIYAVLEINPKNDDGTKQYWSLLAFCCPWERDSNDLGRWLGTRFALKGRDRRGLVDYAALWEQARQIDTARQELIPRLQAYIRLLEEGRAPEDRLSAGLDAYESQWAGLREMLSAVPDIPDGDDLSLSRLNRVLGERNSTQALIKQALSYFDGIRQGMLKLYEEEGLPIPMVPTPDRDFQVLQEHYGVFSDGMDFTMFRETLEHYRRLHLIMNAREPSDEVMDAADRMCEHFKEIAYKYAIRILRDSPERSQFLSRIDDITALLDKLESLDKHSADEAAPIPALSVDELFDRALHPDDAWPLSWIRCLRAALPENSLDQALILGDLETARQLLPVGKQEALEGLTGEATLFGAASRLLAVKGNQDRLAEQYLLFGLRLDARQCAPVLLRLYREAGQEKQFQEIWTRYHDLPISTLEEDTGYWLAIQCAREGTGTEHWDSLESFLGKNPRILRSKAVRLQLQRLTPQYQCRPTAFWAWLGVLNTASNTFETVLEENDLETALSLLDDKEQMKAMGYQDQEVAEMLAAMQQGMPVGMDSYSRAQRLLTIQKGRPNAAEKWLWAASQNHSAVLELFDLYFAKGDYASVCWIVDHFSLTFTPSEQRTEAYIRSLVENRNAEALASFVRRQPVLCCREGVLELLAGQMDEPGGSWSDILRWHREHPFVDACPFEESLIAGDLPALSDFLADRTQMARWGYSEALQAQIREWLAELSTSDKPSSHELFGRISALQGNLHRTLERLLYRYMETEPEWSVEQLFRLFISQQRYPEAVMYYDAYASLTRSESCTASYLRALIDLRQFGRMLDLAVENPHCLQQDPTLAKEVFRIARDTGQETLAQKLQRVIQLLPRDRFEESVIHMDMQVLQQMLSEPNQLLDLGYSREEIKHFKECASHPFSSGSDSYSVANRVRAFLGDARAEPFLLASNSPRAARLLFTSYSASKRWDDLCCLYRKHSDLDLWNNNDKRIYINALSKAALPENCQAFLDFVDGLPDTSRNNSEIQWLSLRALLGADQTARVDEQEEHILSSGARFVKDIAQKCFHMLWSGGSDQKEHTVLFASRLLTAQESRLSSEEQWFLVTVDGLLLEEPDREGWAAFLRKNGLEEMLWLLNCYSLFEIRDSDEKRRSFTRAMIERLSAAQDHPQQRTLSACWEYAHQLPGEECGELIDPLLHLSLRLLALGAKTPSREDWQNFLHIIDGVPLTEKQYLEIVHLWRDLVDRADSPDAKETLLSSGMQLYFRKDGSELLGQMPDEAAACIENTILDTWLDLLEQGYSMSEPLLHAFETLWSTVRLTSERIQQAGIVWETLLDRPEGDPERLIQKINFALELATGNQNFTPPSSHLWVSALVALLKISGASVNEAAMDTVRQVLQADCLDYSEMSRFIEELSNCDAFGSDILRDIIAVHCEDRWHDLLYRWNLLECQFFDGDEEKRNELLEQILKSVACLDESAYTTFDEIELKLLYEAVCKNLSVQNIHLLRLVSQSAGKTDSAEILTALEEGDWQGAQPESLGIWLAQILETRDMNWFDHYSHWWAPLVRLSPEDQQTKIMSEYLGLNGERITPSYQSSITRLLLSDMADRNYQRCYLRLSPDLPLSAVGKLECIGAKRNPDRIDTAIHTFLQRRQYEFALDLILFKMDLPVLNSSLLGQMLGELYTKQVLETCPALRGAIPAVFAGIQRVNITDVQGAWKNIGRAVDIACAAQAESCFFEIFGDNVLLDFPDKCAVVIANLVLRGEFTDANRWLTQASSHSSHRNLTLLERVVERCIQSGKLNHKDELLTRSIPQDGNTLSLESCGELIKFAFDQGWEKDCARAFAELYRSNSADKALAACCIQLYMANRDEFDLSGLYQLTEEYLNIVQPGSVVRIAKSLAVIHSCLSGANEYLSPDLLWRVTGAGSEGMLQISGIAALERTCKEFLYADSDQAAREEILLRAATGWWRLDYDTLRLLEPWETLMNQLVTIYPVSFASACFSSALYFQADNKYQSRLQVLLLNAEKDCGMDRCARYIPCVSEINPIHIPAMIRFLDRPMELPGLYPTVFEEVLKTDDPERLENELTVILAVQPHYSFENYQNNLYHLKEKVDTLYPQHRRTVLKVLTRLSTDGVNNFQKPDVYLSAGNYLMVISAAEYQLDILKNSKEYIQNKRFYETLNKTYLLLGKILTGQIGSEENIITLTEFVNMANLLCQSEAYGDINMLMDLCRAKWKICIRCVQELIQGKPSNILYVLRKKEFQRHVGCATIVENLARSYVSSNNPSAGINLLRRENQTSGRPWNWGLYLDRDIPHISGQRGHSPFLFHITRRNYISRDTFQSDMDTLFQEMRKDELLSSSKGLDEEHASEVYEAYRSFRTIPYVIEQVQRWSMEDLTETDNVKQRREQLTKALEQAQTDQEYIDCYGQLIALDWNSDGSTTICWYCVAMGLRIFDQRCKDGDRTWHVTPDAREILYSMSTCIQGASIRGAQADWIKTGLQECLASYDDLSALISDCSQERMLKLCQAITDEAVQKKLNQHIHFVRKIGKMLATPMTNMERLEALKEWIAKCQSTMTSVDIRAKQALMMLLNKQVRALQGMANVVVTVYNDESTQGTGKIFGKVENLGQQDVSSIRVELSLNGVVSQRYTLAFLSRNSMVPFDFTFDTEEDRESLTYSLSTCFVTGEGKEEQAPPVEGTLELKDPEELDCKYAVYTVDVPVSGENYTERKNLEKVLNTIYSPQSSFVGLPNLAIYGMRRMGKSSVMRWLERKLTKDYGDTLCYVETSGEGAKGDLTERIHSILIKQVLTKLRRKFLPEPGWEKFSDHWEYLPTDPGSFKMEWIDDFYFSLHEKWFTEQGLVVLVDEADGLLTDDDRNAAPGNEDFSLTISELEDESTEDTDSLESDSGGGSLWDVLSRITQRENSGVRFVFCGSDFFTNKIVEGDNLTQFFQRIKKLSVGRMDRIELEETIRSIEGEGCSINIHPDAIEYLWSLAGGLPWHSKLIVNSIIENRLIHEENSVRGTIYPSDIIWGGIRILDDIVASSDNNFGLVALSADEQQILQILTAELKLPSSRMSDSALRQRFHEAVGDESWQSRYERAKKTLLSERQIISRSRMEQEEQYRFGCELYRLYNRQREKPRCFIMQ